MNIEIILTCFFSEDSEARLSQLQNVSPSCSLRPTNACQKAYCNTMALRARNGGFLKKGYPQIMNFSRIFHEINHPKLAWGTPGTPIPGATPCLFRGNKSTESPWSQLPMEYTSPYRWSQSRPCSTSNLAWRREGVNHQNWRDLP